MRFERAWHHIVAHCDSTELGAAEKVLMSGYHLLACAWRWSEDWAGLKSGTMAESSFEHVVSEGALWF